MQQHQAHQHIIAAVVHVMFIFSFFCFFWMNNVKWHFVILCFCKYVLCIVVISLTSLLLSLLLLCGEHCPLVTKKAMRGFFFSLTLVLLLFFSFCLFIF